MGTTTLTPIDYALHVEDRNTLCYHAPYREYAAGWARWTTRDPLGMVDGPNEYAYVGDNPVCLLDTMGLRPRKNADPCESGAQGSCQDCCEKKYNDEAKKLETPQEKMANGCRLNNQLKCCNLLCNALSEGHQTGQMGNRCWTVCGFQYDPFPDN
jgi:RHS repeat-associated protein